MRGRAGLFVVLAMAAVGYVPLFGGPGYEHALATGLVAPSAAAVATSLRAARGKSKSLFAAVGEGVATGLLFAGLSLATALLHVLRVGICDLFGALLYFALTAGAGAVAGGVWGAVVGGAVAGLGTRVRRVRTAAVVLALAGPASTIALGLADFYGSPMIFAFDPFVGYFSGTLYDTIIDAGPALLTYRLGTLATLSAVALFASVLGANKRAPSALTRLALGTACGAASLGVWMSRDTLGHHSTPASIRQTLGGERHGLRCDVFYPSTTRERDALLLVKDCDEQLASVERALGAKGPDRVRAYFFRDENEKKRLMGAAHTYIAKPWREEVYLQLASYPHPVLGHELAHVVAGSFGRGPFRIAGDVFGLLPNPGLIEGVAVAASPDDDELTDAEWARAMMDIGILPSMKRVFSLGFLGDASAKSYTLAGAFLRWLARTSGQEVVRAWYRGGDISALTHKDWASLEGEFRAYLASLSLSPEAQSFARAKFARPGIFGRRCPHAVDALRREGDECRDAQRFHEAVVRYDEALSKDALDFASRHARAQVLRRWVDRPLGARELEDLATAKDTPRSWRDRAEDALADADFLDGQLERAATRWESLAARSLDEDAARTYEVKALGARDPAARRAVQLLLLGDETHSSDVFVAGVALGEWHQPESPTPLASYLIGRQLVSRSYFEEAARLLDEAVAQGLPTARLGREALRQRTVAACASSDGAALARLRGAVLDPQGPFAGRGGRLEATLRLLDRCTR